MTKLLNRTPAREQALALVRERGYERRDEPFKLASGATSHDYIDGKHAIDSGPRLMIVARAIVELARSCSMEFDAVGGLTMGADAIAHGVAIAADSSWFSVRKEPKPRGLEQWIEGARLGPENRVLLVDDVVTSGGSVLIALERVLSTGAIVTGVITMVDRGEIAAPKISEAGVPYAALATYADLGIDPVEPGC